MNAILFNKIIQLDEFDEEKLLSQINNSPILAQLYHTIKRLERPQFNNYEIVETIYKEESKTQPYSKLENRYFKLRKKLLDEIDKLKDDDKNIYTDIEHEVYTLRNVISTSNAKQMRTLIDLEKRLLNLNLFDMLPSVYEMMIAINQKSNKLDENTLLFSRFEKSIELNADMHKMKLLSRKAYEANFKSGFEGLKSNLSEMHKITIKHKDYQRFSLIYHFVSLYYKLSTEDYPGKQKSTARHFNTLQKIIKENPQMPIVWYKPDYIKEQKRYMNEITAFYHYSRMEFSEAYIAFNDIWESYFNEKGKNPSAKSETVYYNMIQSCISTRRYERATNIAQDMVAAFKEVNQTSYAAISYVTLLDVYCSAYPIIKLNNIDYVLEKSLQMLKHATQQNEVNMVFLSSLVISRFHYVKGESYNAIETLKKIKNTTTARKNIIYLLLKFYQTKNNEDLGLLYDELNHYLNEIKDPETFKICDWIMEMIHLKLYGKRKFFALG